MSDILASVSVVLGAETSGFKAAMADARRELKGLVQFSEGLKSTGEALSKYVTLPILGVGGAAVKMAGDMEKAQASFTTMLGSASAATATLKDLKTFAADTPFEFPEIQDAAKKLLAFNTPAKDLKETLRQLGDISAGIDAPIGEIAELFGKARVQGRLFQEDINQLTGRGIPIIQELAKQFGVAESGVRKLVESGKVNFGNLQTAFADLTKEGGKFGGLMEKQSATLPGLFSTLSDTIGQGLADLGTDIVESLDLKGAIKEISSFVQGAADAFRNLSPEVKKFLIVGAAITAAIGPALFAIGALGAALPALSAGFVLLSGPIGLVAAGVATAAVLIIKNWDGIVGYFTTGEGGRVFGDLAQSVSQSIGDIKAAISSLAGLGKNNFGTLISATSILKTLLRDIAVGFTALSDVVGGTIGAITKALSRDFTGAAADAKRALFGLVDPIANVLGFTKKVSFSEFFGLGKAAQQAGEQVDGLGNKIAAVPPKLAGLSDAQQKALDSLRKNLLDNENASRALGAQYDFLPSKAKILESGIKSLTDAGFGPASKTVRDYVAQLRGVPAAMEQLQGRQLQGSEKLFETPEFKLEAPEKLALPELLEPDYKGTFARAAQQIAAGNGQLAVATELGSQVLTAAQENELDRQRDFNTNMEGLTNELGSSIGPALAGIAVQFGDAFGSIVAGTSSAGDALQTLFGGILQAIGGFMSTFGQQLIVIGIGKLALDTLFKGPLGGPLAIAAGLGLVALAGVVSAVGKSASASLSNIGSGGTGGSVSTASPSSARSFTPTVAPTAAASAAITNVHKIEITASGRGLAGVLQLETDRLGRVTGMR
jgi:tape measure domain-containing protein